MISIQINDFINGYSIVGYDSSTGKKFIDEIQEERLEVLKAVYRWVGDELEREYDRRKQNASTM